MGEIPYHPLANIFPLLEGDEFLRLVEDIRVSGLRFPIIIHEGQILDGRNRHRACIAAQADARYEHFSGSDPVAFVVSANLARRHLNESQRASVAVKLANMRQYDNQYTSGPADLPDHLVSQSAAAMMLNVSERLVRDAKKVSDLGSPELIKLVESGDVSVSAAADVATLDKPQQKEIIAKGEKEILKAASRIRAEKSSTGKRKRAEKIAADAKSVPAASTRYRLMHCAVIDLLKEPAASADLICTDPPYPKEFLSTFNDLAKVARHILKPGGLLVCMSGQTWLPEVLQQIGNDLTYQWTLAYLTPGGQATQIFPRRVNTFWKPVFVFSNGTYDGEWYGDVARSDVNDNDKDHHHWGQSESGMHDLMRRFVRPGYVVVDPFLGGGTTAVIALTLGASFIGCDVEQAAIDATKVRLADAAMVA